MSTIRVAQLFNQNYFIGQEYTYLGDKYDFAPFQVSGAMASLGGDNETVQVLFPNLEVVLRLVEEGDGNRLSELTLTTLWLNATGAIANQYEDYYVGSGAGFNDDTVELRFRSAMDSVGTNFPARTLTSDNVGILPLNAELYLR
jgi:hypothetical protein